jgi:hypothetical protein
VTRISDPAARRRRGFSGTDLDLELSRHGSQAAIDLALQGQRADGLIRTARAEPLFKTRCRGVAATFVELCRG